MALFKQKNERLVGVDFGSATIKLVEIEYTDPSYRLVTYGIAQRDHDAYKINTVQGQRQVAALLQEVVQAARVNTIDTVTAIPALSSFNTVVTLPHMPDKELGSAVQWEAKKLVPLPIEKMKIDWQRIPPDPRDDKDQTKVIITAAPLDIINAYINIFRQVNLNLKSIETEITALRRSLVPHEGGTFLLVDMGATNTNLVLFNRGIPRVNRNVEVGGKTITQRIAESLNVQPERAEQFKNDIGLPLPNQQPHPAAKAAAFLIDNMIVREIKRLSRTIQSTEQTNIKKVILIGGCSHLKNLPKYIEHALSLPADIGNPWEHIIYPRDLQHEMLQIGPQLAVAVGLAMKTKK